MPVVYRLVAPNGKSYIGYTKHTAKDRFKSHLKCFKSWQKRPDKVRACPKFYNALTEHGIESWTVETLFESEDPLEVQSQEVYYIQLYNSIEDGYNRSPGGIGGAGIKHKDKI